MKKHLGLRGRALHASLLCTAVLPSYLLYGYNQAVMGGIVALPSFVATFPTLNTATNDHAKNVENSRIQGTVVAIYTAAGIFGSLFCIWSGDRFGRRKTIVIGAVTAAIGAALQCSSYSLGQLIAGRVIAGLGNGGIIATVPNLQSETSPPAKRGGVVQWLSVFALAGLAVAGWVELGMYFVGTQSVSWRFPLALPIFFAILIVGAMTFTPESPRWLVSVNRVDEAKEVFSALYDMDSDAPSITQEVGEIQGSMDTGEVKFSDAFKMGPNRLFHRFCICCGIQMFQQITGVNCLAYFEATIFSNLGLGSIDPSILAASVFTFSALVSTLGVFTVDRFGRRPMLLISALGNGISMAIIAGTSSQPNNTAALAVACLFIFLFFFFFPVGFLGVTFLYAAEVAPSSIRGPITAISTATVWAFNFMTVEVTPVGLSTISYKFYIVWAVMNLIVIFPCVYFFFPETKGMTLEGIDRVFQESKNIFEPVWVAKRILKEGPAPTKSEVIESNGKYEHDEKVEHA